MVEWVVGYTLGMVIVHCMNAGYGLNRGVPRHLIAFWLVLWPLHVTALVWLCLCDTFRFGTTPEELDEQWPARLEDWFDATWRKWR